MSLYTNVQFVSYEELKSRCSDTVQSVSCMVMSLLEMPT